MALRLTCLALWASLVLIIGSTDQVPSQSQHRQKLDPDDAALRQQRSAPSATAAADDEPSSLPSEPEPSENAGDVVALDYPLATGHLDELVKTGVIEIPHPEGGLLQLTLRNVRQRHGSRVLLIASDGLPGVITQRGDRFVGTIATRAATYALSSQGGEDRRAARLVDQRQLDLRVNPHQPDYQRAPLPRT